jgi:hypothetical protein
MTSCRLVVRLLIPIALLAGCGGDEPREDEACQHLRQPPGIVVIAPVTPKGAPAAFEHQRRDVSLMGQGYLYFEAVAAGRYDILLSEAVPVLVRDTNGVVAAQISAPVACAAARSRLQVTLPVATYTLELGPTAIPQVALVVERAGD